jgi:hypothetical protein
MNSTLHEKNLSRKFQWYDYLIGYFPFVTIFLGLIGNPFTFIILRTNKVLKKQSSMVVFSFISILDLLSLFTWNLDTYFRNFYEFDYEMKSLIACRLMVFLQYFGLESSALLLSFISIDRYFTIISKPGSFVSKLPFGTPRNAFIWSSAIIIFIFLLNSHILILNGYLDQPQYLNETLTFEINGSFINKTILKLNYSDSNHCYTYSSSFRLYPFNNILEMSIYSLIPFAIMTLFNSLIIYKTFKISRNLNANDIQSFNSYRKKLRMTVSLVVITSLFLLFTLPNTIFFGFFFLKNHDNDFYIGGLTNHLVFLHHSTIFFSLFFTNIYFRKAIFSQLTSL